MKHISLDDATDTQLRIFAETMGLTFDKPDVARATILKKLKAVYKADTLPVEDEDAAVAATAKLSRRQTIGNQGNGTVIVTIHTSDKEDGNEPVQLMCNGKFIFVPRGQWCEIKSGYFESLKNAEEARYAMRKNPDTGLDEISDTPTFTKRFPYSVWNGAGDPPEGVLRPPEKLRAQTSHAA